MPEPIVTPAAVPPQAPAPAKPTLPPAAQAGASPIPALQEENKMVPITALHEEREKRQQLQTELEAMKKIAGQNMLFDIEGKPVQQQYQPQPDQRQQHYQQEMDKLWETDPRKAVQAEIYTAMSWRDNLEAQVDAQERSVSSKYNDFDNYRSDVRQYIRTLPFEQRANPGVVELAYYVVRGQKVDNIIAKTREQMETDYRAKIASGELAQGMPGGAMSVPPSPQGAVTLSADQKAACAALNLSEADYIKHMVNK